MTTDPHDKLAAIREYLETNPSASAAQALAIFFAPGSLPRTKQEELQRIDDTEILHDALDRMSTEGVTSLLTPPCGHWTMAHGHGWGWLAREHDAPQIKAVAMPEAWAWEDESTLADSEGASLSLADADTLQVELDHEADCPRTKIPLACIELLTGRRFAPYAREGKETAIERKLTLTELSILHGVVASGIMPRHERMMVILDHAAHDLGVFEGTRVQVDARTALELVLDLPSDTPDEDLVRAAARARLAEIELAKREGARER